MEDRGVADRHCGGTSTAARHASIAPPWASIHAMIGRTRFAAFHIMKAVATSTHASAKTTIAQNSDALGSVYSENRPSVARQTMKAETNSNAT